jgi:hypothetical protein
VHLCQKVPFVPSYQPLPHISTSVAIEIILLSQLFHQHTCAKGVLLLAQDLAKIFKNCHDDCDTFFRRTESEKKLKTDNYFYFSAKCTEIKRKNKELTI